MSITCPECGEVLDPKKVDIEKHAYGHWGVIPKDIFKLQNPEAAKRYKELMKSAGGKA